MKNEFSVTSKITIGAGTEPRTASDDGFRFPTGRRGCGAPQKLSLEQPIATFCSVYGRSQAGLGGYGDSEAAVAKIPQPSSIIDLTPTSERQFVTGKTSPQRFHVLTPLSIITPSIHSNLFGHPAHPSESLLPRPSSVSRLSVARPTPFLSPSSTLHQLFGLPDPSILLILLLRLRHGLDYLF